MVDPKVIVYGWVLILLETPAAIVNAVLIIIFIKSNKHKNTYQLAFVSLAASDFVLSVFAAALKGPGMENIV